MSFCKCDIIIPFAVHLYGCTLYERPLQLNCFHNGFFTGDIGKFRPWNREHCKCKSSEFILKAKIEIEFLGQNSTLNPITHQLLAASLLAR